jgi:uncharacterized protein YciI
MQFDQYTITLLIRNPDGPKLDEAEAAKLQDAHMAHIADLHEAGHLLIAGPLFDERLCGLSILKVGTDQAWELEKDDPAVTAGMYTIQAIPWVVPGGAMTFAPVDLPRSMAQAQGD